MSVNGIDVLLAVIGLLTIIAVCDLAAWCRWNTGRRWERQVTRGRA